MCTLWLLFSFKGIPTTPQHTDSEVLKMRDNAQHACFQVTFRSQFRPICFYTTSGSQIRNISEYVGASVDPSMFLPELHFPRISTCTFYVASCQIMFEKAISGTDCRYSFAMNVSQ